MRIHRWNGWSSADRSCRTQPVLERGHGREVWDTGGRRYLDGIAAAANTPFGHAHPQLTAVVAEVPGSLRTVIPRRVVTGIERETVRGSSEEKVLARI
ncbi:aminotransferase class III-fold pyridoxal phosphate-dependent enzyme [Nocardia farcinica]|uniref:aminotransferase class III-fold pyridoxal phosphate-dependent enzyme n=1 Tax=Nocardia farcinica TaxID=37329 RepID=UPI003CC7FB7C